MTSRLFSALEITNALTVHGDVYMYSQTDIRSANVEIISVETDLNIVDVYTVNAVTITNDVISGVIELAPESGPLVITSTDKQITTNNEVAVCTLGNPELQIAVGVLEGVSFVACSVPALTTEDTIEESATLIIEGSPEVTDGTGTIVESYSLLIEEGQMAIFDSTEPTDTSTGSIVLDGSLAVSDGNICMAENKGVNVGTTYIGRTAGVNELPTDLTVENATLDANRIIFSGESVTGNDLSLSAELMTEAVVAEAKGMEIERIIAGANQTITNRRSVQIDNGISANTLVTTDDFTLQAKNTLSYEVLDAPGTNVDAWTIVDSGISGQWQAMCWSPELEIFVAVGSGGGLDNIKYSSDGIIWTNVNIGGTEEFQGVCWSAEKGIFVAVGYSITMYSDDGINWTSVPMEQGFWYAVAWSPELILFVTVSQFRPWVGDTYNVAYSPDGINWNYVVVNTFYGCQSISWSPELELFVAVSDTGPDPDYPNSIYSSNGIDWTPNTITIDDMYSISWSPELELFVAVGSSGANRCVYSSDGINWASVNVGANNWTSVCWSPELRLFVAVANFGANRVMYSYNAIDWTLVAGQSEDWFGVSWSPKLGLFVAVAFSSANVMYSNSFDTWDIEDVTYSSDLEMYCGVGSFLTVVAISYNYINWRIITTLSELSYQYIIWIPSASYGKRFIATNFTTNSILYSENGTTWSELALPGSWTYPAFGNDTLVIGQTRNVAGSPPQINFAYSTVFPVFNEIVMNPSVSVEIMFYENNQFIGIGGPITTAIPYINNYMSSVRSVDGIRWEENINYNIPATPFFYVPKMTYSPTLDLYCCFIKSYTDTDFYNEKSCPVVSSDGINWKIVSSMCSFSDYVLSILWINTLEIFIGLGCINWNLETSIFPEQYAIHVSRDGYQWGSYKSLSGLNPIGFYSYRTAVWNEDEQNIYFVNFVISNQVIKIPGASLVQESYSLGTLNMSEVYLQGEYLALNGKLAMRTYNQPDSLVIAGGALTSSRYYSYVLGQLLVVYFVISYTGTGFTLQFNKPFQNDYLAEAQIEFLATTLSISSNLQATPFTTTVLYTPLRVVVANTTGATVVSGKLMAPYIYTG